MQHRLELLLGGRVQGVGFRPFVYRIASEYALDGWVRNENGRVRIQLQGTKTAIEAFIKRLITDAPVTAQPKLLAKLTLSPSQIKGFFIRPSLSSAIQDIHLPPDYFLCHDCLKEMFDPQDRRHQYPFINCTICGPRYSIICALPYDRENTSMSDFPLCQACLSEYQNPANRRFHAEPIACPNCGPQLNYTNLRLNLNGDKALDACVEALRAGEIVIVKGIGGYHICCDASNEQTIQLLRQRKHRPDKPLALMFPASGDDELEVVRNFLEISDEAKILMRSPARPIVLLERRNDCQLPGNLAPRLSTLGAMLSYSPLHTLLLSRFAGPIVATSANISGEPVITDNKDVSRRLSHISENFLHHNRSIVRPVDDSVFRIILGQARPIRLGRGSAALELELPNKLPCAVIACGGHMKNSVALAWENRVVISPHIGDLDSLRSQQNFASVIADLQRLYQVNAQILLHDKHPGYFSSRWAQQQHVQTLAIYHHHAHASLLVGEYPKEKNWLVFTWDGVGLGEDNTLWGGEAFFGSAGEWRRCASWQEFQLLGGDQVARQPWRSALALCWQAKVEWSPPDLNQDIELLHGAWLKNLNSRQSSAIGRLFDAASALLGLCDNASFEGQAAMLLEHVARGGHHSGLQLPLYQDGTLWRCDWSPLLTLLMDSTLSSADRAYAFHVSLADALINQVDELRKQLGDFAIGLSGGVFQNQLLCELIAARCKKNNWRVYLPQQVPVNDAGLCYGQVIETLALFNKGKLKDL